MFSSAIVLGLLVLSLNQGCYSLLPDSDEVYEFQPMPGAGVHMRDDIRAYISDTVHQNWGYWGEWAHCDQHEYALVARIKIERYLGKTIDDTSVNGIEIACGTPDKNYFISSAEGRYGDWGAIQGCKAPDLIVGFGINVERHVGSCTTVGYNGCDDTATNALKLICGTWLNGELKNKTSVILKGEVTWGVWQEDKHCPKNTYVCGIQTQIDRDGRTQANATIGDKDVTGLNGVAMACCG